MSYEDWSREDKELGAAITGMIAAIALFRRNGIDPVGVCASLNDDDSNERIIGRRLYDNDNRDEITKDHGEASR